MAVVLVVDDESSIRALLRGVLARLGHEVVEACDGIEALGVCQERAASLDLLLTDIVMPRLDGLALAERVVMQLPGLPVIYMSGQCDIGTVQRQIAEKGHAFLGKPFHMDVLAEAVRAALAGRTRKPPGAGVPGAQRRSA